MDVDLRREGHGHNPIASVPVDPYRVDGILQKRKFGT